MKSDFLYLEHIQESIRKIEKYTKNMNLAEFLEDEVIQDVVIRQFEIIGEASNHISELTTTKITDVPWSDIVGFRNVLIHDYFEVDLRAVWSTVKNDLPNLKDNVEKFLNETQQ